MPYMCRIMMVTLTMRAFFLLSLFAFLGTRARNLPGVDDKFKISYTNNGETSNPLPAQTHDIQIRTMTNFGKEAKPALAPPHSTAPSKGHLTNSSSCLTGSTICNIIITSTVVEHKPSLHPPPPPETGGGEHYLSPKAYISSIGLI